MRSICRAPAKRSSATERRVWRSFRRAARSTDLGFFLNMDCRPLYREFLAESHGWRTGSVAFKNNAPSVSGQDATVVRKPELMYEP